MPTGTDATFALELRQRFETHASFAAPLREPLAFTIRHYAGDVTYLSTGFCAKNKVTLTPTLTLTPTPTPTLTLT